MIAINHILLAFGLMSGAAQACTDPAGFAFASQAEIWPHALHAAPPSGVFPMVQGAACAFAFAGPRDAVQGSAATALRGMWTVQFIHHQDACRTETHALVTDCSRADFRVLHGAPTGGAVVADGGSFTITEPTATRIEPFIAPLGPIELMSISTMDRLERIAARAGVDTTAPEAFSRFLAADLQDDRIDPFCGCKTHFPDSAGANP